MAERTSIERDTPPDVTARDIIHIREQISGTLKAIGEKFSSAHVSGVVKETLSDTIRRTRSRGSEFVGRARKSARSFGSTVQDSAAKAKSRMLMRMKEDPLAAGIIAFEIGVVAVAALQGLRKRRSRKRMRLEPAQSLTSGRTLSLEEAKEQVKNAALQPDEELKKAA